jgi:signal transduction histidine kinase
MSHELRTPLNHIIGYSEILMEETEFNQHEELYTGDLKKVHGAGKTLLHIITQILELAKLEAGRVSVQPEEFALNSLIEDVSMHGHGVVEKNNNTLTLDLPAEKVMMVSDPHKLRQSLVHLLNNAAQFTQEGQITIRAISQSDLAKIEIEDTGEGIPSSQLENLFQSFANSENVTRQKNEGLGLGLATAHQLIRLLGGTIQVRSEIGEGSTFTVQVPLKVKEA